MALYHAVPRTMTGTVLYPLNQLQEKDGALYKAHAEKYHGRERVMQQRIPLLGNCLWNDVLFLTAVHPAKLREALEGAGHVRPDPFRAFKFDVEHLNPACIAVMMKADKGKSKEYEPFDPARLAEYAVIPQKMIDYWREERAANQRPFLYLHIPHILYCGTLDTAVATIVEA